LGTADLYFGYAQAEYGVGDQAEGDRWMRAYYGQVGLLVAYGCRPRQTAGRTSDSTSRWRIAKGARQSQPLDRVIVLRDRAAAA
jgi:hypothetical protein